MAENTKGFVHKYKYIVNGWNYFLTFHEILCICIIQILSLDNHCTEKSFCFAAVVFDEKTKYFSNFALPQIERVDGLVTC